MEKFIDLCIKGLAETSNWEKFVNDNLSGDATPNGILGISECDFRKLVEKRHTFDFYVKRKSLGCGVKFVWPGTYVSFLNENDSLPHVEFGWVDVIDVNGRLCKVQCDDSFHGMRAIVICLDDIKDILPLKERPLVYYKTMVCGDCNKCDRSSNDEVPSSCPSKHLLDAVLDKQRSDSQFLLLYSSVK